MDRAFPPSHRGGTGSPMVLLHGFTDTWRTWDLVLPALEQRHDVLALTLAGHLGGPPLPAGAGPDTVADLVEAAMDAAGVATPRLGGDSPRGGGGPRAPRPPQRERPPLKPTPTSNSSVALSF